MTIVIVMVMVVVVVVIGVMRRLYTHTHTQTNVRPITRGVHHPRSGVRTAAARDMHTDGPVSECSDPGNTHHMDLFLHATTTFFH